MKARFRNENDDWNYEGSRIDAPEKLGLLEEILEKNGPIIVQHWHYRGSCAPDRLIFDDYEKFTAWLGESTFAGDAIDVWSWDGICKWENRAVEGKCPDEEGLVPRRGAY